MKLSETLEEFYTPKKIKISREMIDFQQNDPVVGILTDTFQELINEVNENNSISSAVDMQKDFKCLNLINKLDNTILERFGITTKHIAAPDPKIEFGCYGVLITSPKEINAITGNPAIFSTSAIKDIEDELKQNNFRTEYAKNKSDVQTWDHNGNNGDTLDVLYNYKKSLEETEAKMKASSVVVDRKKAKIFGLPDGYISYFLHDFYTRIKVLKNTPRELTASLLHEVGHAFTYIEYSYRSITNCSVLMDTFIENLAKKNKSPKESLILGYERYSGNKDIRKEVADKNTITATIYILDNFIKENMLTLTGSTHATSDSEQLADQFAGRFGCGPDLISSHVKISKYGFKEYVSSKYVFKIVVCIFCILSAIGLAIIGISGAGFIISIVGVISALLVGSFIRAITNYYADTDPGSFNQYDTLKRQCKRIRNELIRNLRNINFQDKEYKEKLILSIDEVDNMLKFIPEAKIGVVESLLRFFSKSTKHKLEIRTLERLIEDLSENNLHLAAVKLQSKI